MTAYSTGFRIGVQPPAADTNDLWYEAAADRWWRWNGTVYVPTTAVDTRNLVTTGEETHARDFCAGTQTMSTGVLRITFWTCRKTQTVTQVVTQTGGTGAAATPSICRVGIFTLAANGDGTLAASTANDTAMWATASTRYAKALQASLAMTAGTRYAVGFLCVTATTAPTLVASGGSNGATLAIAPRQTGLLNSQADLPSSFTDATLVATGSKGYAELLP